MRATRAYIAGFGTAGSLLAGAAILFVFASAVVSFRGWPGDVVQSQPVAVVPARTPQTSPQVRRVETVAAAQFRASAPRPGTVPAPGIGHAAVVQPASPTQAAALGRAPDARVVPPQIGTVAGPTGAAAPPACTTGGCLVHRVGATLGGTATTAGSNAGSTVTSAGGTLGSVVTAAGGALGGQLGAVDPVVGKVVSQAGALVGTTLTNATSALGATLAGAGRLLGGLLSGPAAPASAP